jgi:hypothetical protein
MRESVILFSGYTVMMLIALIAWGWRLVRVK